MLKKLLQRISLAISFSFFSINIMAQIQTRYHIGSIGMTGSSRVIYSGPIALYSDNCFNIKNGTYVFDEIKNGVFSPFCSTISTPSSIQFIVYPNPIVTIATLKAKNVLPNDASPVVLKFVAMDGKVLGNINSDIQSLANGLLLNPKYLNSGVYAINVILNDKQVATLKIIKAN